MISFSIEPEAFRTFTIQDDAMDYDHRRAIEKGDDIVGLPCNISDIAPSDLTEWVLITNGPALVRHITKVQDGVFTLTANNEDKSVYLDQELSPNMISEIFKVVKVFKYR